MYLLRDLLRLLLSVERLTGHNNMPMDGSRANRDSCDVIPNGEKQQLRHLSRSRRH